MVGSGSQWHSVYLSGVFVGICGTLCRNNTENFRVIFVFCRVTFECSRVAFGKLRNPFVIHGRPLGTLKILAEKICRLGKDKHVYPLRLGVDWLYGTHGYLRGHQGGSGSLSGLPLVLSLYSARHQVCSSPATWSAVMLLSVAKVSISRTMVISEAPAAP